MAYKKSPGKDKFPSSRFSLMLPLHFAFTFAMVLGPPVRRKYSQALTAQPCLPLCLCACFSSTWNVCPPHVHLGTFSPFTPQNPRKGSKFAPLFCIHLRHSMMPRREKGFGICTSHAWHRVMIKDFINRFLISAAASVGSWRPFSFGSERWYVISFTRWFDLGTRHRKVGTLSISKLALSSGCSCSLF